MKRIVLGIAALIALTVPSTGAAAVVTTSVFVPGTAADFFGSGGPAVATGVVLAGQQVVVRASGLASCSDSVCFLDANGSPGTDPSFLATDAPLFSLVGRVGSGPWQFIGVGPTKVTGVGELFLAYNDNFYGDNEGGFDVTIKEGVDSAPAPTASVPTASYCAPTDRGWTFLQVSPGQLEAGFWHDAIAAQSSVVVAGETVTFTGSQPVLAALVPDVGLTCDQPWFVNGTYADPRYALRDAAWDAAFGRTE